MDRAVGHTAVTLTALSAREREVLAIAADGLDNEGIAQVLHISVRTVESHMRAIFSKLRLAPKAGYNCRVRAAFLWLDAQGPARR